MRNVFATWLITFSITSGFSQPSDIQKMKRYSIGAQYTHEFVLGGYVQVRDGNCRVIR